MKIWILLLLLVTATEAFQPFFRGPPRKKWRKKLSGIAIGGLVWWKAGGAPQPAIAAPQTQQTKTTMTPAKVTTAAGTVLLAAGAGTVIGKKIRRKDDEMGEQVEESQVEYAKVGLEEKDSTEQIEKAKEQVEKLLQSMPTSSKLAEATVNETSQLQKEPESSTTTVTQVVEPTPAAATPTTTAPVFFEEPEEVPTTLVKETIEPEVLTKPKPTGKTLADYTQKRRDPIAALTADLSIFVPGRYATNTPLPLKAPKYRMARMQPKAPSEEQELQQKYGQIESVEDRAYQILVDLGMIEPTEPMK